MRIKAFLVLIVSALFVSLGVWQYHRLIWKTELIAEIQSQAKMPEVAFQTLSDPTYRHVTLEGRFALQDRDILLSNKYLKGVLGYHQIALFKINQGPYVIVDCGWIPQKTAPILLGHDRVLHAFVKPYFPATKFQPQNSENAWYRLDQKNLEDHYGVTLAPFVFELTKAVVPGPYPIPVWGMPEMKNNHLGYMLTWFGLAIGIWVVFGFYVRGGRT